MQVGVFEGEQVRSTKLELEAETMEECHFLLFSSPTSCNAWEQKHDWSGKGTKKGQAHRPMHRKARVGPVCSSRAVPTETQLKPQRASTARSGELAQHGAGS